MEFLYNIHTIISHCFFNNYRHWKCVYLFSLVLKKKKNTGVNTIVNTETIIY